MKSRLTAAGVAEGVGTQTKAIETSKSQDSFLQRDWPWESDPHGLHVAHRGYIISVLMLFLSKCLEGILTRSFFYSRARVNSDIQNGAITLHVLRIKLPQRERFSVSFVVWCYVNWSDNLYLGLLY